LVSRDQLAALAIVGLVLAAVVVGAVVYYSLRLHGHGTIKLVGLKAYSDPAATLEVSAVDWGLIPPGGVSQVLLYLKSTSTTPANWTLTTENWDPSAAQNFMVLTWDYDGGTLQPGEIRAVRFTLQVSVNISAIVDFALDIVVTAAG